MANDWFAQNAPTGQGGLTNITYGGGAQPTTQMPGQAQPDQTGPLPNGGEIYRDPQTGQQVFVPPGQTRDGGLQPGYHWEWSGGVTGGKHAVADNGTTGAGAGANAGPTPSFTSGMTPDQVRQAVTQFYSSKGVTPNPTSIDYWTQKYQEFGNSDPGYFTQRLGQADEFGGGSGGGSSLGSLGNGFLFNPMGSLPSVDQLKANPGFQYGLDEAMRGLQAGAAARGTLLNGRTQQAIGNNLVNYALGSQYIPLSQLGIQQQTANLNANNSNFSNLFNTGQLGLTGSSVGATGRPA